MDKFETHLRSDRFLLFMDKTLRIHACEAVERFRKDHDPVDRSQLHPIPAAIQAGGFEGLRKLVQNQRDKNTKEKNKVFWNFLFEHAFNPAAPKGSLQALIRENLEAEDFLRDEKEAGDDKQARGQIKKENKNRMNAAMERVLEIYFEHFNCHFYAHPDVKQH
jgi:hypothetical protein